MHRRPAPLSIVKCSAPIIAEILCFHNILDRTAGSVWIVLFLSSLLLHLISHKLNYGATTNSANVTITDESVAITTDYVAIEAAIDGLNASQTTIKKAKEVYKNMGTDGIFGRSDISSITGDSVTAAGNLISKLKAASLIVPVKGYGKGKYRFIEPHK